MDYFSQYGGHEASSSINVPPRVESITDSSSSESVSDTAGTSPFLNAQQLPLPDFSKTFTTETLQPTMQEEQNAFASTSAQPAYYPMPAAGYMSFQAPFSHNPSAPPSPPLAAALSQTPSPVPIPNPSTSMPVPMPMPHPEFTPPVPVTNDVRDSGVDFGLGIRPPSQAASTAVIATEPPLFRARSLLGFAKSQSRLGFVRPRPPTATTVTSESSSESDLDSDLNLIQPHYHTWDESTRALIEGLRPVMESCIEIVVRLIPTPQVSSAGRLIRLPLGREEAVCASMEGTLRHLWGCITLRPGCACPSEREQEALPEGERGSDVCREFHEAFERKLRRFTTRMRTFHEQINRPRRMHRSSFTERLLGWQDAFDQWINRFEVCSNPLLLELLPS
ncbi:hypothetical protein F5879DRAFT_88211 [Lentinula edodes]|nr:hypothetical protein F5879DRAFT_88211 [Lentinula edodes]